MRAYFAYGANMAEAAFKERCPGAVLIGPAELRRHRFRINARGVATVINDSDATVLGLLWSVGEADLETLDLYEGVPAGLYRREEVLVDMVSGKRQAICYVAADSRPGVPRVSYLEGILESAADLGFPYPYLAELKSWQMHD